MKKIFIFIKITNENLHGLDYHNNLRSFNYIKKIIIIKN